jgi:aldose 1-epimerase
MSFIVDGYKEEELSLVRLQDTVSETIITVLPGFGALLHGFEISLNGYRFNIIDNYTSKEDVEKHLDVSFKSSKLSPFVCRIKEGKYHFRGRDLVFNKKFSDGSAIHGLLYNQPFKITDQFADDMMASVTLRCHYRKDDHGYPFEYICETRYILHPQQTLQVETTVLNLEESPIPIADGWHPYFQLGNTIDDYELQFSSSYMLEFSNELIPTGNLIPEASFRSGAIIGKRMLDNCFVLEPTEGPPCCVLHNPKNGLSVSLFTNAGYPYLQIFTPPHRKSIAIENLSAAPDCFNNGLGLLLLPPRHSHTFNAWYRVSLV